MFAHYICFQNDVALFIDLFAWLSWDCFFECCHWMTLLDCSLGLLSWLALLACSPEIAVLDCARGKLSWDCSPRIALLGLLSWVSSLGIALLWLLWRYCSLGFLLWVALLECSSGMHSLIALLDCSPGLLFLDRSRRFVFDPDKFPCLGLALK